MNVNDLYQLLDEKRELVVSCNSDTDYYALRTGIYNARRRFITGFSLIDGCSEDDGFQLLVRRDKETNRVTLTLSPKEPARQWTIIEESTASGT